MTRGPLTLAALASAAVPGLDPDTVEGVVASGPADSVEVAFIQDREHRRWVIRCPRTPAASAQLERSAALLAVLARRLTMPVPAVKGWAALPEGGRAAVHSYLTGRLVTLEGIEPGSTLAAGLGRALAHLHNLDPRMYEEAGVPVYDAAGYRSRRLAELDRAAATGRVPTGLLGRWERVLDDESLWAFTATPTHGAIGPGTVLATPDDGKDVGVKTFLGWESAQVADPADDMAPLLAAMDAEAFDTVMEAYAHTRVERPDRHLYQRAEIVGEMQLVRTMMSAVAAGDDAGAEQQASRLRRLDDQLARAEEEAAATHGVAPTSTAPIPVRGASTRPAAESNDSQSPHEHGQLHDNAPHTSQSGPLRGGQDQGDDADDDAVQVERPAKPTPVAPAAEDVPTGPIPTGRGSAASSGDASAAPVVTQPQDDPDTNPTGRPTPEPEHGAGSPAPAEPEAATATGARPEAESAGEAEGLPAAEETDTDGSDAAPGPTPRARQDSRAAATREQETGEIIPIDDDDGDDVVPLRPRQ